MDPCLIQQVATADVSPDDGKTDTEAKPLTPREVLEKIYAARVSELLPVF